MEEAKVAHAEVIAEDIVEVAIRKVSVAAVAIKNTQNCREVLSTQS